MTPMELFKRQEVDEKGKSGIVGVILTVIFVFFSLWFVGTIQEHQDCINGIRPEVCIPEDFQ